MPYAQFRDLPPGMIFKEILPWFMLPHASVVKQLYTKDFGILTLRNNYDREVENLPHAIHEYVKARNTLRQVSRQWNQEINNDPTFWSNIGHFDFFKPLAKSSTDREQNRARKNDVSTYIMKYPHVQKIFIDAFASIISTTPNHTSPTLTRTLWLNLPTIILRGDSGTASLLSESSRNLLRQTTITTLVLRLKDIAYGPRDVLDILQNCSCSKFISNIRLYVRSRFNSNGSSDGSANRLLHHSAIYFENLRQLELEYIGFDSTILPYLDLPNIEIFSLKDRSANDALIPRWELTHVSKFLTLHDKTLAAFFIQSGRELLQHIPSICKSLQGSSKLKILNIVLCGGLEPSPWQSIAQVESDSAVIRELKAQIRNVSEESKWPAQLELVKSPQRSNGPPGEHPCVTIGWRDPEGHADLQRKYQDEKLLVQRYLTELSDKPLNV